MGQNGTEWDRMGQNGTEWDRMGQNGTQSLTSNILKLIPIPSRHRRNSTNVHHGRFIDPVILWRHGDSTRGKAAKDPDGQLGGIFKAIEPKSAGRTATGQLCQFKQLALRTRTHKLSRIRNPQSCDPT